MVWGQRLDPFWHDLDSVGDHLYGLRYTYGDRSGLWYRTQALKAAFKDSFAKLKAQNKVPFMVPARAWAHAEVFETLLLRVAGADFSRALAAHKVGRPPYRRCRARRCEQGRGQARSRARGRFVRLFLFRTIHSFAAMIYRECAGREASPSAGILDNQIVKAPAPGAERSFDGAKKIVGGKHHFAVDTDGRLLMVNVTAARIADSALALAIRTS